MAFLNPVVAIHRKSGNGRDVGVRVVQVGEIGERHCYRAEAIVSGPPMAHSHHDDRESAAAWVEGMVDAYLEVHAK